MTIKKYVFAGTNKHIKHFKKQFPKLKIKTELTESEFSWFKANGWLGWFKEL